MKWKNTDLSSKLYLTCGSNFNYFCVHHHTPTLPVEIGSTLEIFKTNQLALLSIKSPSIFSSWSNWREEEGLFWRGCKKGAALWDDLQEYLVVIRNEKVSPFVKFETIVPFLCFLLDPLKVSTAGHRVLWKICG